MDKDLFSEKVKNAFDNFEADPPEYILDRIKSTHKSNIKSSRNRSYKKAFIIASVVAVLSVPLYFIINQTELPQVVENETTLTQPETTLDEITREVETVISDEIPEKDIVISNIKEKIPKSAQKSFTTFAGEANVVCGLEYKLSADKSSDVVGIWSANDNSIVNFISNDDPNSVVVVSKPGKYRFKWTVTQNSNTASDEVEIEFVDVSYANAGRDMVVCEQSCELNSTGLSGNWISPKHTELSSPGNPVTLVKVSEPGTYLFIWKEYQQKCKLYDTVKIQFVEPFNLDLIQKTTPICVGDIIEIEGVYNSSYKAIWDFFDADAKSLNISSQNNIKTEMYSVRWTDNKAHKVKLSIEYKTCVDEVIIDIDSPLAIKADYRNSDPMDEVPAIVYFSNLTQFGDDDVNNSENIEFTWSFGDGSTSTDINPDHLYMHPGVYQPILIVSTSDGCADTIKGEPINVRNSNSGSKQRILTPNGDGDNDVFRVNSSIYKSFTCIILSSRTSEKVYEWSDPNGSWDGRINGNDFGSTGMYYYIIRGQYYNNESFEIPGVIYLMRD